MTINISAASELMQNNMQADIMSPQKNFQALQTQEGHTLFFSIGTDNVFYLTREVPGNAAGWIKTDLSEALKVDNNDVAVIAKTFMVAQNLQNNTISIILAVQGENQDFIYTALTLDNTDATWENPINWTIQAYDDALHDLSNPLFISQVYIAEVSYGAYIVVDIVKNPDDPNQFISTYFLDPTKAVSSQVWNERDLAINLNANNVQRVLGIKSNEWVYGTYTLGTTVTEKQLVYTPFYNVFNTTGTANPPNPSNLIAPEGASCLATVENIPNYTALFVSGDQTLYYFPSDAQNEGDAGQLILQHELFLNVTQLYANSNALEIVVWGLNQQGQVFYTKCPIGQETDATAWSIPIPILSDTTQITTYLNNATNSKVLFAHTSGTNLIQLAQDPLTSLWTQSNIILPSTDMDDVIELTTYTTHIQVSTEDNLPATENILARSTSPVSVYINNQFTILSPGITTTIPTDANGTITILQPTDTIGCVCYNLEVESTGQLTNVNPMAEILDVMAEIETGQDLADITVTNADGSTQPLMPSTLTDQELDAMAQAIQQFVIASETVPADGSVAGTTTAPTYKTTNAKVQKHKTWGLSFKNKTISYHHGNAALSAFGPQKKAKKSTTSFVSDIGEAIVTTVGDIFNWVQDVWEDVTDFFVEVAEDIYNCFITVAGKLYTFALDCLEAILSVIQLIFDKVAVLIEDLIKWIGFLFQWDDILRTKDVMKNMILQYMNYSVAQVDLIQDKLNVLFQDLEAQINDWADIDPPEGGSLSSIASDTGEIEGQNDPQSNFAVYHMNNGLQDASTTDTLVTNVVGDIEALFQVLLDAVEDETEILEAAFNLFKTEVLDQIRTLDISEIIKRTIAIISNTLLASIQNILNSSIDIIKILIDGVIDIMSSTINIPVLSWLYKEITGNELSILDAGCLLIAIPSTLLYKIARNEVPFADNATTTGLIEAESWESLQAVFNPPSFKMAKTSSSNSEKEENNWSLGDIAMVTAYYGSTFGGLFLIGTSTAKQYIKGVFQAPIYVLNGVAYFAATIPTLVDFFVRPFEGSIDVKISRALYLVTGLQQIANAASYQPGFKTWNEVSPIIDLGLGFISMPSTFLGFTNDPNIITASSAIANTTWNCSGIVSPITLAPSVTIKNAAFWSQMSLIALYSAGEAIVATEIVIDKAF